jgi:hypothetical protein
MLNGFKRETEPLNSDELAIAHLIAPILKLRQGKAQAVTNTQLAAYLLRAHTIKCTGARMRKIINHIRLEGIVPLLIATSKGYYIADTKEEVESYLQSLTQRISAIAAVRKAILSQFNDKYYASTQQRLPLN